MRIGLVYDRLGDAPRPPGAPPDWDAEYEPEDTILALEGALRHLGHEPVRVGNVPALLAAMAAGPLSAPPLALDAAVNVAESYGSRNREAHAPVLLELAGIPALGSDALTLSVSLDKHLTKTLARAAGLRTPDWALARAGQVPKETPPFPVFVKPRYEGTAKGIAPTSRCDTAEALHREVARQWSLYRQDLLVEAFVAGAEFTASVVGTREGARPGPALQRAVERETGIGLHALERHERPEAPFAYDTPAAITPELEGEVCAAALAVHCLLECRDFSRSDFRVDGAGRVWLLEVNPLPSFAPDSTFAVEAELAGKPYVPYLSEVLSPGLDRVRMERAQTVM